MSGVGVFSAYGRSPRSDSAHGGLTGTRRFSECDVETTRTDNGSLRSVSGVFTKNSVFRKPSAKVRSLN